MRRNPWYDTVIFDLDGTLLDTLDDLTAAVNEALRQYGMPVRTRGEVRRFVGNGVRLLMKRAVPDGENNPKFEAVLEAFRSYYAAHSTDFTRPYDGIYELLKTLRAEGYRTAVVSNKFQAAVTSLCTHYFPGLLDVVIGENEAEGIRKKPAPDTVLAALAALNADPARTVYVGDSEVDAATARAADLACISVLWGFREREVLYAAGAICLCETVDEVLSAIRNGKGVLPRPSVT